MKILSQKEYNYKLRQICSISEEDYEIDYRSLHNIEDWIPGAIHIREFGIMYIEPRPFIIKRKYYEDVYDNFSILPIEEIKLRTFFDDHTLEINIHKFSSFSDRFVKILEICFNSNHEISEDIEVGQLTMFDIWAMYNNKDNTKFIPHLSQIDHLRKISLDNIVLSELLH